MDAAFFVVLGHALGMLALGWGYFRRYRVARPPLGVLTRGDTAMLVGGIILAPLLYLLLPSWLAAGLLAAAVLSALQATWEPVLPTRAATWLVVVALLAADLSAARWFGAGSPPFFAVNNLILLAVVVGIANLWAQGGMRARDVALLAGFLALYDVAATSLLPLTDDLIGRLAGLPFAPVVAWPVGDGRWLGLGLGDLLIATLFPLVARKAFGRPAGRLALVIALGVLGMLLALVDRGVVRVTVPVMAVLGPAMVLQFGYWHRRQGGERTTWRYLQVEPLVRQ